MNRALLPPGWPMESDWTEVLDRVLASPDFFELFQFINKERLSQTIYPTEENVFNAFRLTPYARTKVVILGQDPYHGEGQANGLSFSVEKFKKIPPSLQNIFKELFDDLRITSPQNGDLQNWAHQGVLMLNNSLTVEKGMPGSHQGKGWEKFTDSVLKVINKKRNNVVFILWGRKAQEKCNFIDKNNHLLLESAHPSPFSAHNGFFGSKPFSKTNTYLKQKNIEPIDWQL